MSHLSVSRRDYAYLKLWEECYLTSFPLQNLDHEPPQM
jgi:hypothetical protein